MEFPCLAVATGLTLVSGSHSQPHLYLVDGPAVNSHPYGPFAVPCSCPCHSNTAHLFITAGSGLPSAQTQQAQDQNPRTHNGPWHPPHFLSDLIPCLPPSTSPLTFALPTPAPQVPSVWTLLPPGAPTGLASLAFSTLVSGHAHPEASPDPPLFSCIHHHS